MAKIIVTLRVMPESVETDLNKIENSVAEIIRECSGDFGRATKEPIAFGLKALDVIFLWEESRGGTDDIEKKIKDVKGVLSAEVTDVRRAIG